MRTAYWRTATTTSSTDNRWNSISEQSGGAAVKPGSGASFVDKRTPVTLASKNACTASAMTIRDQSINQSINQSIFRVA